MSRNHLFNCTSLAPIMLLLLQGCAAPQGQPVSLAAAPSVASGAPAGMQLCNGSSVNFSVLSSVPPRALNAGECIAAPFDSQSFVVAHADHGAGAPVLTISGDDDPLSYTLDLLSLPAPFAAQVAADRVSLQVDGDHKLYWMSPGSTLPGTVHPAQPPNFPLIPVAD